MFNFILIGLGGFVGAILRYFVSGLLQNDSHFPLGTLGVNVLGSFFLSFVMFSTQYWGLFDENARLFFAVGLLGAFTTMSTFSYESFKLLENGYTNLFLINVVGTVVLTLFAVFAGRAVAFGVWKGGL